jgi:hypothetical protein
LFQQQVVEVMPGLAGFYLAQDAVAAGIEITDQVEDLVVDQFLAVAQSLGIDNVIHADHHCIVKRPSLGQAGLLDGLDLFQQGEGTRVDDREGIFHVRNPLLLLANRLAEFDGHGDIQGAVRLDAQPGVVVGNLHRPMYLQIDAVFREFVDAGLPHTLIEFPGRTVQDGNFRAVDIYLAIGDAGKIKGSHEMFNGGYRCSLPGNKGREPGVGHHVVAGGDSDTVIDESNSEFASGEKFKGHRLSGMQADASDPEDTVDGCLAFDHCRTMADFQTWVNMQPPHVRFFGGTNPVNSAWRVGEVSR